VSRQKWKKALKWLKTRLEFTALPRWRKYSLSFHHHEPNRVNPGASVLWDLHVHSTSRGPNTYTRVCTPSKKTDRSRHWCNALQQYTNCVLLLQCTVPSTTQWPGQREIYDDLKTSSMCIVKVPVNKIKVQCIVSSHSHTRVSHCLHFADTKTDLYTRYRHQTIRNRFATRAAPWWVWVHTTVSNPCCHLVSYSGYAPFMHRLYIPGHYVQTWRHLQHRKHINASQSR